MKRALLLLCALSLAGCELIIDQFIDCIDNDHPEFEQKELSAAVLYQEYSQKITVDIKNEGYDDNYDYRFKLKGKLPPGLSLSTPKLQRKIKIVGIPTELGVFEFKLFVTVTDPSNDDDFNFDDEDQDLYDDGDGLCSSDRTKTYTINVLQ